MQEEDLSTVKRAQIFLKDHGLRKDSWTRRIFLLTLDLSLMAGLVYYCYIIHEDWPYWETCPMPFHAFIVVQYILISASIRLPIMNMRQNTQTQAIFITVCLLVLNTIGGIYMFRQLTECDGAFCDPDGKKFSLTEDYMVHAVLLIMVPASVFVFLLIVLVKLICFILADRKKARGSGLVTAGDRAYGQFEDENSEDVEAIEAVVSVYFKIMDKVTYENEMPSQPYIASQS